MDLLDALAGATDDNPEGRVYGFVLGRVTDITDPNSIGRVKARYGAMDAASSSDWIMPAWIGAMEGLPRVGDYILVAFIDGNVHKGIYFTTALTRSQNRPVDFVPLGLQICGVLNALVDAFNGHVHADPSTGYTGTPVDGGISHLPRSGVYCQDGRGSKVSSASSDTKVLSSEAKVR